jgi:hypothetical protein
MASSGYNKFLATTPGMGPVPAAASGGSVRTRRMRGRGIGRVAAVPARNKPNRASAAGGGQQVGGGGGGRG